MITKSEVPRIIEIFSSRQRSSTIEVSELSENSSQETMEVEEKGQVGVQAAEVNVTESYSSDDERKVVRVMDFWILPVLGLSYALQYWDKVLLGQSVLFGLARDLDLIQVVGHDADGNDITRSTRFSNVSWVFYLGYLVAAYPWIFLTHRFPTAKVCAASILIWSVIIISTAACKNYSQLMLNRFFLGAAESCLAPAFTVYVSFWYTRKELALRSSLWFGTAIAGGMIVGPLLSYSLGHIHEHSGHSWKYIYIVAGAISVGWSVIVLWVLPDDPQTAKWLSPRNRSVILARLKAENSGSVNRHFVPAQFREALTDYNLWSNALFHLGGSVTSGALTTFSSLVIHGFGFDKFTSVLMLVPLGFVALLSSLISGFISARMKGWRYYGAAMIWTPAIIGALISWRAKRDEKALLYIGLLLLPATVGAANIVVAQTASNTTGHTKKATVSAGSFIGYCVGQIIGPLTFSSTPGPRYEGGFITILVFISSIFLLALFSRWHLGRENARRDREYGPPNDDLGLEDLTDKENKNLRYLL